MEIPSSGREKCDSTFFGLVRKFLATIFENGKLIGASRDEPDLSVNGNIFDGVHWR